MVGTVKKSMAAIWPTWFFRKMRQFCEGGLGWRIMYLATVDSATAWPSRSNSDRILGAPQVAFSRLSPRKTPSGLSDETNSPYRTGVREQSRQVPGLKLDRLRPDVAVQ